MNVSPIAVIIRAIKVPLIIALLTLNPSVWATNIDVFFSNTDHNFSGIVDLAVDAQDQIYILSASELAIFNANGDELNRVNTDSLTNYKKLFLDSIHVDRQSNVYITGRYSVDEGGSLLATKVRLFTINASNQIEIIPISFDDSEHQVMRWNVNSEGNIFSILKSSDGFQIARHASDGSFLKIGEVFNSYYSTTVLRLGSFNDAYLSTYSQSGSEWRQNIIRIDRNNVTTNLGQFNTNEFDQSLPRIKEFSVNIFGEVILLESSQRDNWRAFRANPSGTFHQVIDSTGDGTGSVKTTAIQDFGHIIFTHEISGNSLVNAQASATDALGNFYVSGATSNNVFKISRDGTIKQLISETGDGAGNTLEFPSDMVVDSRGNVFVLSESKIVFRIQNDDISISTNYLSSLLYENMDSQISEDTQIIYGDNTSNNIDTNDIPSVVIALNGNDTIKESESFNIIYGGGGHDTAQYKYDRYDYALSQDPLTGDTEVISKSGDSLGIAIGDIETLKFRDIQIPNTNLGYWGRSSKITQETEAAVFRFLNVENSSFFYTTSETEAEIILAKSSELIGDQKEWPYVYQGATFSAASRYENTVNLHRYFNSKTGHHFFTANESEVEYLDSRIQDAGWPFVYEGVAFEVYLDDPNGDEIGEEIAVHRFYSSSLNRHVFTASPLEALLFQETGIWQYEGIGFYADSIK